MLTFNNKPIFPVFINLVNPIKISVIDKSGKSRSTRGPERNSYSNQNHYKDHLIYKITYIAIPN